MKRRLITWGRTTASLQEWSRRTGIDRSTIATRLNAGMPPEKALTLPPRSFHSHHDVTHCPQGHLYDAGNTIYTLRGKWLLRTCRKCKLARRRAYGRKHAKELQAKRKERDRRKLA